MPATVRLIEIVDTLETQSDEQLSFLDTESGEVVTVSRDLLGEAGESGDEDEGPDLPAWQAQEWEAARQIVSTRRFKKLPTKFDVHEWAIMQEFAESVESARIREELLDAIHGSEAFRNFKSALRRRRIEQNWYAFRTGALRQIAIEWCEENRIPWE